MKFFLKPVIAILVFCVMQLLAGTILFAMGINSQDAMLKHPDILAGSLIASGLLTALVLYLMKMYRLKVFDPRRINWPHAHLGIIGVILGIFAIDLASEFLDLPDLMQVEFTGLAQTTLGILAIAVIGPIVEEIVFRASIIGYLTRNNVGKWTAIAFSSIAFGLIHFNPAQIPCAIVIGALLGIVYVKSRSVILTSIIHIANNSLAVYEINRFGDTVSDFRLTEILGERLSLIYIVLCGILCYTFVYEFIKKYHRPKNIRRHHHRHHSHYEF